MRRISRLVAALACGALALAACGTKSNTPSAGGSAGSGGGKVGVDFPRADSDFWNAYNRYVPQKAKDLGVDLLNPTNSANDIQKLVANVQGMVSQGAKAIVMAPQDTAAIASTLDNLAQKKIPVVSVDTRPDKGQVYMVVRA